MRSRFLTSLIVWLSWMNLGDSSFAQPNSATLSIADDVHWERRPDGVRVCLITPSDAESRQPRERVLLIYACPNGNTIEQTLGCARETAPQWRYDIQHVAAQFRHWRSLEKQLELSLAVVEAPQQSWPTYCSKQPNAGTDILELVESLQKRTAAQRLKLAAHSGGGSFLFSFLDARQELPATLERLIFLDANYAYADERQHGDKLLKWLHTNVVHRLVVIAYDDREIMLNGKRVVGPEGGTFRASQRMLARFRREGTFEERDEGPFTHSQALDGRIDVLVHRNPQNKILHTALVGDMNGLLYALTCGAAAANTWGNFGGPRAYERWIPQSPILESMTADSPPAARPAQTESPVSKSSDVAHILRGAPELKLELPPRRHAAPTGSEFARRIERLSPEEREAEIRREILAGNIPDSLRRLTPIRVTQANAAGERLQAIYYVTSDYLGVGIASDFFRTPLTPKSAVAIADAARCTLITAKISDDLHRAASVKLPPKPLTQERESTATFLQHHRLIEEQLNEFQDRRLIAGIKKDLVWTKRLFEKPRKEAIYGWHHLDGRPIQPLYVGHVEHYVDYSHGVRFVAAHMRVGERWLPVVDVLGDKEMCGLLSNEGPMDIAELRKAMGW